MNLIKKMFVWILLALTLNLCVSSGTFAATDIGNNAPEKVTVHTPKDKAASVEELPGSQSWFSEYKWWLLAGLVVLGGAAAAGGGGGGGGSSNGGDASVTVGW